MVSFDFSQPSILRRMFMAFVGFGLGMGLVFPIFANIFVEWKDGMLIWFILACIVAGISIGMFNYWLLNKMLLKRLMRIGEVANAISQNDISHKCSLVSNDFIGDMASSFNKMSSNLRTMVKRISEVSEELSQASEGMLEVSKKTHSGVDSQKQGTHQVANAINKMNETVVIMSENSQAASTAAKMAEQATDSGVVVVNKTIQSIEKLAQEVEQTAAVIKRLKTDSENIGSVLIVIKDISEQTNLLALNAAIEAARAGEHGRGFAVVADEVRMLAGKTQESAKQIETMIEHLQDVAEEAVKVMHHGQNQANQSVSQAIEAGNSLKSIGQAVNTITQMNEKIANSAENQRKQSLLVKDSMLHIQEVADQVAQGANHTSSSCSEVSHYAVQLHKLITQFKT